MSDGGIVGSIIAGTVLFIGIIVWGGVELDKYTCHQKWDTSGRPVRWGFVQGCQVQDKSGWVPAENYRSF